MKNNLVFFGLMIVMGVFVIYGANATANNQAASQPGIQEATQDIEETPTMTPTPTPTAVDSTEEATGEPSETPEATFTPTPTAIATVKPGEGTYNGQWTAAFTLNRNTFTGDANLQWYAWALDLHQEGNKVTGTMEGIDIAGSGKLWGTVDNQGNFQGNMRLSWDDHDWESLSLNIAADGQGGYGVAVYKEAKNNLHYYDLAVYPGIVLDPIFPIVKNPRPITATPTPITAPRTSLGGRWMAAFTCNLNTYTGEVDQQWFTFQIDLTQQGNQITGTMQGLSIDVTGVISGTVNEAGYFDGVMRLSWDDHDWNSLSIGLAEDGLSAFGNAVFQRSKEELHYYSIYLWPVD